jgi:hypothetical protein
MAPLRSQYTSLIPGDFGLGGLSTSILPKEPVEPLRTPPSRPPDAVIVETPPEQIALWHRLAGDTNKLRTSLGSANISAHEGPP